MIYLITGVSRGLGKAIAELCLQKGSVIGIGRSHSIDHPDFSFLQCDLSDAQSINELEFPEFNEPVTLINNAGIIGTIGRISNSESSILGEVLQVNTIAPTVLLQKVYGGMKNKDQFTLVNISSGAANRAIPSWAAYCASKAAINMLSETFYLEEKELGNNPKVFCVAPGVIDTDMQAQIRSSEERDFSQVENFIRLKNDNQLFSTKEAAARLLKLLEMKNAEDDIFFDLRQV